MRIAILGGGGFIGSAIINRLLRDGHFLRVLEKPSVIPFRIFSPTEQVEWVYGDFAIGIDFRKFLDGIDVVLHLVSTTMPKTSNDDPIYDVQTNLVPVLQLLNEMRFSDTKKIIYLSSGGTVYGDPKYLPIDEAHQTEPRVSYGITKLAIEKYLQMYQKDFGIRTTILRVSNPYGERQNIVGAQGAVGVFIHKALQGLSIEVWGDGTVTRDYIYVEDVAEAVSTCLTYNGPVSVFNISSGIGISLNELINILGLVLSKRIVCRFLAARSFDVNVSVLDNKLARSELGWQPKIEIIEGIRRTAEWIQTKVVG